MISSVPVPQAEVLLSAITDRIRPLISNGYFNGLWPNEGVWIKVTATISWSCVNPLTTIHLPLAGYPDLWIPPCQIYKFSFIWVHFDSIPFQNGSQKAEYVWRDPSVIGSDEKFFSFFSQNLWAEGYYYPRGLFIYTYSASTLTLKDSVLKVAIRSNPFSILTVWFLIVCKILYGISIQCLGFKAISFLGDSPISYSNHSDCQPFWKSTVPSLTFQKRALYFKQ